MFNKAVKSGVEKGEFTQPKGKSTKSQFLIASIGACPCTCCLLHD